MKAQQFNFYQAKLLLFFVVVGCGLSSCGLLGFPSKGERLIKRADRLIRKAELHGASWKRDTVYYDTVIISRSAKYDTLLRVLPKVPVDLTVGPLRLHIQRLPGVQANPCDSLPVIVEVAAECVPDTIRIRVPVMVNNELRPPKTNRWPWWKVWLAIVIAFGLGIVFSKPLKRLFGLLWKLVVP